jgi:hypothetical protein
MSQVAETPKSTSLGDKSVDFPEVQLSPAGDLPPTSGTAMTGGSGLMHWDKVKQWVSDKPLRIRNAAIDVFAEDEVNRLAEDWIKNRPRGVDVHEQFQHPAYRAIIRLGLRAVGPLLMLVSEKPDHWFYALHRITYANPVPPESEGNFKLMAEAWIAWGRERGYIGDVD